MLIACQAAAVCVQRLLAQPSPLSLEHQEYARRWEDACALLMSCHSGWSALLPPGMQLHEVRLSGLRPFYCVCLPPPPCRRTRALLLQLCAAAEAAARAGEPLAAQVQAAWGGSSGSPGLPHLLGALLEACGSVQSSTAVELSGTLLHGLVSACGLDTCAAAAQVLPVAAATARAWSAPPSMHGTLQQAACSKSAMSLTVQSMYAAPVACPASTHQHSFTPVSSAGRCTGVGGV